MKPRICAVITSNDERAVSKIEPGVEMFEVRIDLIGDGWQGLAKRLKKPWIACARSTNEGGKWDKTETEKIETLTQAVELGAKMVDLEFATKNLDRAISLIKKSGKCLLSF